MFKITEKDILEVYKEDGKIKEYDYCIDYIKFMDTESKKTIKEIKNRFCVSYNSLLRWKSNKRIPYGIKCLNFLKEKKLLPYYPNEITARIVGLLHGDGYLTESLGSFGFVSKDEKMLLSIKKDVKKEFKIKMNLKKKRDIGNIEFINGKKVSVKVPTYELRYNSKGLGSLLFKLGVPKGRKIYQKTRIPKWVMEGKKEIKKSFLQGLFDSELFNSSISTYKGHKNNLGSPRMEMGKEKKLIWNLNEYLLQIRSLLKRFKINSTISCPRNYSYGKISLTLKIKNNLINIYNFIDKIGFYYNILRVKRAKYIKKLILEKIKKKNSVYKILEYCKSKPYFTIKNLENDLGINTSSSKTWGIYLKKYGFVIREMTENRVFKYFPKLNKINQIIKNPLLLEGLPKIQK